MPRSEAQRTKRRGRPVRVGSLILVVIVFIGMFLPLVVIIGASFTAGTGISFPPKGFSAQYYVAAVQRPDFVSAFFVSLAVGVGSAALAMLVGVPAAIGLVRYRFRGRGLLTAVLMSPIMVPTLVTGILVLSWYALVLGWQTSVALLIAGHLVITLPFVVRLSMASLTGFDSRLEIAARGLGAGSMRAFISVTLPNIMPGLIGAFAFAFIRSFDDIGISIFLASKGVQTLPVLIYSYITQAYDPLILAVASFMVIIVVILMIVLDRVVGVTQLAMASYGSGETAQKAAP